MAADTESRLVQDLVGKFKQLLERCPIPPWAFPYKPAVPFVGKDYESGPRILVYGSAENLRPGSQEASFYNDPEKAFLRRWHWRQYYSQRPAKQPNLFFGPGIGIEPFDSGGLLVAVYYAAWRLGMATRNTPQDFVETLAVSNWCKFSINSESGKNRDYANNPAKLKPSFAYVVEEIKLLKPSVVILPKKTYQCQKKAMDEACREKPRFFVPVPQFAYWVINHHLKPFAPRASKMRAEMDRTEPTIAKWMGEITVRGAKKGNHWRFLAAVADVLDQQP